MKLYLRQRLNKENNQKTIIQKFSWVKISLKNEIVLYFNRSIQIMTVQNKPRIEELLLSNKIEKKETKKIKIK